MQGFYIKILHDFFLISAFNDMIHLFYPFQSNLMTAFSRGQQTETKACAFLQKKGLLFVARNYRCQLGEIDLIMQDKETLVFVEVRYRHTAHFGDALDSVHAQKQKKIILTAQFYLQQHHLLEKQACRFDVLAYSGSTDVIWIPDAFC